MNAHSQTRKAAVSASLAAHRHMTQPGNYSAMDVHNANWDLLQAHIAAGDMDEESVQRALRTQRQIELGLTRA